MHPISFRFSRYMAVSAFKSTSKRGNLSSTSTGKERIDHSPKKVPPRRSRSVSTLSRAQLEPPPSSSQSTTVLDFLNKRDNPLFRSGTSPPSSESAKRISKFDKSSCESALVKQDNRKGRSVLRNSDVIEAQSSSSTKIIGRSLSQVRRRSVSRGHYGTSEVLNFNWPCFLLYDICCELLVIFCICFFYAE